MTKHLFSYLVLAVITLCFIACGNDDDCDTTCPEGAVQLTDCSCFEEQDVDSEVQVTENITSDVTWTAGKEYVIAGRVAVESGATLTIEPGTVVKGEIGQEANAAALLIARGARLMAVGTAEAPIIFTSAGDNLTSEMVLAGTIASPNLNETLRGLWGGLIILGNAPISIEGNAIEAQIEGIPTSDSNGLYGGADPNDNSGVISYVSIRHGGTNIGEGNEINGLTLGGVGNGTTIDNIEIVANADDGIEWFGGTVNVNNALVWSCGDDGMDTDQDWVGNCHNWIVALSAGGSAMELDGPEGDQLTGCNFFTNGTIYAGDNIDHIIDFDEDTNTGIVDLYVFGVAADYDATVGFETFGGNGGCSFGSWEYTVPAGYDGATLFAGAIGGGQAAEVEMNANTIGADSNVFGWTYGAVSGTLTSIGL